MLGERGKGRGEGGRRGGGEGGRGGGGEGGREGGGEGEGGGREGLAWMSSPAQLEVGEELLQLQTYDRLFQRVVTVYHYVPLGLYRTVPLSSCPDFQVSLLL